MKELKKITLVLLGLYLLAAAWVSLDWRIQLDLPVMLYLSFIWDQFHLVPYREIFDMNMPGVYPLYLLIGKLAGYRDLGVRLVDLALLGVLLTTSYFWTKKLGRDVALLGAILFGLCYLRIGPIMSLEREFLCLVLIVTGVWIYSMEDRSPLVRSAISGLLFGIAATIKPHSVIGVPVIILWDLLSIRKDTRITLKLAFRQLFPGLGIFLAFFCIPWAAAVVILLAVNALPAFGDILFNYLPLYGKMNGFAQPIQGMERLAYDLVGLVQMGGYLPWLLTGVVGLLGALLGSSLQRKESRQVVLLVSLSAAYWIYPVFSGQFWFYHWILFLYFILQLAALCFLRMDIWKAKIWRFVPIAALIVCLAVGLIPTPMFMAQIQGEEMPPPDGGLADEISAYLQTHLRPGDLVQPLDWTGGAVHAMLLSHAKPATPFVYDFHFYHHVSQPYIQGLRQRFLDDLSQSQPRYIIDLEPGAKHVVSGADTTMDFPALQSLLSKDYVVVLEGDGFRILERQ